MYFLERKEQYVLKNVLGNCNFPIYSYRWKAVMACEEIEPLEKELSKRDRNVYRITSNVNAN